MTPESPTPEAQTPAAAPKRPEEAVALVLTHLERQAGRTNAEAAYEGLLAVPDLPLDALAALGPLTRLDDSASSDALPSLLLETESGQVQIELCPFGPLALLRPTGLRTPTRPPRPCTAWASSPCSPPTSTPPGSGTATPSPAGSSPPASAALWSYSRPCARERFRIVTDTGRKPCRRLYQPFTDCTQDFRRLGLA